LGNYFWCLGAESTDRCAVSGKRLVQSNATLLKTASPGKIGDGKNFLSELEETIRANAQPALFQLTLNPQIDFRA
jgi:hypothetical protein